MSDWIRDGDDVLLDQVDYSRDGFDQERAFEVLIDAETFLDEPRDAEYAIERLFIRGAFDNVEGDLRVTEPETGEE